METLLNAVRMLPVELIREVVDRAAVRACSPISCSGAAIALLGIDLIENQRLFEQRVGAQARVLHGRKHLGVESGMTVFRELLAAIPQARG